MISILLLVAFVILLSCILDKFSLKSGVPAVLLFISLGMIFGEEGILKIPFYEYSMANMICSSALIFIMFYGGFGTKWSEVKKITLEASLLSSLGVFFTALLLGTGIHLLLHWSFLESFLLGAVLSSTDAASVFSILQRKKLGLKENTAPLLEVESGSNDPCSYMMTLLTLLYLSASVSPTTIAYHVLLQIGGGLFFGVTLAYLTRFSLRKLRFSEGTDLLFITGAVIASYAVASYFGGNGYLSVYIFGILLGNSSVPHKVNLSSFYDGVTGLAQMFIFFLLGLLSTPSQLFVVLVPAFVAFLLLTLLARPISVFLLLAPFSASREKKALVSFAGLRGAASIVFAIMTIEHSHLLTHDIFHIVFCVVLLSMVVQGSFLPWVSEYLQMIDTDIDVMKTFTTYVEKNNVEFFEIVISNTHEWKGVAIKDLHLPSDILIVKIQRNGSSSVPYGSFVLEENDILTFSFLAKTQNISFDMDLEILSSKSPWIEKSIQEFGTKQNSFVSLIVRNEQAIIPTAQLLLQEGDQIYFLRKER